LWLIGALNGPVSDEQPARWVFAFDAQARYVDVGSGLSTWLLRPSVGYKLGEAAHIRIGYAHFRVRTRPGILADEDRLWEQVDWRTSVAGGADLSLRLRLEHRFSTLGSDTRHVARLMVKYTRPLGNSGRCSLVLSAEPFFDLDSSDIGGDAGIFQGRVAAGMAWKTGQNTTLEVGYMYQHFFAENRPDRASHVAVLRFRSNLR
jgi:hypothetical protein